VTAAGQEPADGRNVLGERAAAVVNAVRSVQSRVSSILAAGLMMALGISALTWYYAHALTRRTQARQSAQSAAVSRARGEMPLPSLGPITPPSTGNPAASADATEQRFAAGSAPDIALPEAPPAATGWIGSGGASSGNADAARLNPTPPKAPWELLRERRLAGEVFAKEPAAPTRPPAQQPVVSASGNAGAGVDPEESEPTNSRRGEGTLAALLKPTRSAAVQAQILPTERFILPKGAFIDCTLETAIDSTLPGMTTCVTAADTFGADGKVVLLERGSKLVGETRGQVQQGQARVFVVWSQARTPSGVVVPLDSPGTDELGRAGLPGEVNRHFWERFGAAMLISVVDGAVQAGVQAANHSGGAVIYAPSASQDVLTEVLKDTLQIPPTIVKHNGDRIQVLVARDIDFRSVYELHAIAGR